MTLLGSNSYDGGTIVNGGTLAGTTVTLQGDILDNANVTFDQSATGTYSDTISGSGSVTKAGSGTVTLLGDNTYDGGTIITGGSLHGTTVTLQGDIHINASNANVTFDQAVNGSYTDNITGSGSLTKTGGGTLTLLGDNGYTGGTTVSGGTLAGTTVSLEGDISIAAGAHVILDQSAPGTFVGEITGGGDLTKDGTGTVTLSGTNNYSGGTAVDAGILQGTTSSLQGNIFAASVTDVTFAQAANGSYTGQLSGSRQPDQDRGRHTDPHRHQQLPGRHGRDGRRAQHLQRCQSGERRHGGAGGEHQPRLHRRGDLHPRHHRDGRSDLHRRDGPDGDPERGDRRRRRHAGRRRGERRRHAGADRCRQQLFRRHDASRTTARSASPPTTRWAPAAAG